MNNIELARRSLNGLWVGDCIGNIGQLYPVHSILKALDEGIVKFGNQLNIPYQQTFKYSDDTEEAIILFLHLVSNGEINQDKLAMEWATRYIKNDPDGEKFGYGLMTRTVLKEIYEGKSWREANQTKPRIEGTNSFVDKLVAGVAEGKSMNESMAIVNSDLKAQMARAPEMKIGSCGNGSAMRVAPLGAFFYNEDPEYLISEAVLQAQVTHCHPEGLAGSIAVVQAAATVAKVSQGLNCDSILYILRDILPECEVKNGIKRAIDIPFNTPLSKVIEILGNGTHVTCQDTVPLCCYLVEKALKTYNKDTMYEEVIIETSKAFGDVDTNCAIVGGIIGTYAESPQKWVKFCAPMEGVK